MPCHVRVKAEKVGEYVISYVKKKKLFLMEKLKFFKSYIKTIGNKFNVQVNHDVKIYWWKKMWNPHEGFFEIMLPYPIGLPL